MSTEQLFGEFEDIATECFGFLVKEKGGVGPVPEYIPGYSRDIALWYDIGSGRTLWVGMERYWLIPFISIKNRYDVRLDLKTILMRLGIRVESSWSAVFQVAAEATHLGCLGVLLVGLPLHLIFHHRLRKEYPLYLREHARVLKENFEAIIECVREMSEP